MLLKLGKKRARDVRSQSRKSRGISSARQIQQAQKLEKVSRKKPNLHARKGPGDRHVYNEKPMHLFVGKRRQGTTHHR